MITRRGLFKLIAGAVVGSRLPVTSPLAFEPKYYYCPPVTDQYLGCTPALALVRQDMEAAVETMNRILAVNLYQGGPDLSPGES